MKSIRTKKIKQKIKEKQGAAMLAVLCIMAVFIALAFSILLAASVAISSSQKTLTLQKCKVLATSYEAIFSKSIQDTKESATEESTIQGYLHREMANGFWYYYDEEETFHSDKATVTRSFEVDGVPEGYTLEITMYWTPPTEGRKIDLKNPSSFQNSVLNVAFTCKGADQAYKLKKAYTLSVTVKEGEKATWIWNEERKNTDGETS